MLRRVSSDESEGGRRGKRENNLKICRVKLKVVVHVGVGPERVEQ